MALIEKHDLDYLLANIKIVEDTAARGGVKNPSAYLMKAIQNDYRPTKGIQNPDSSTVADTEVSNAVKEDRVDRAKVEEYIASLSSEILEQYRINYKLYLNDNPLFKRLLESKGFDSDIIQYQWIRFVGSIMEEETE